MKKLLLLMVLIGGLILSSCDLLDFTGTWVGNVNLTTGACTPGSYPITVIVIENGNDISGTVSFRGDEYAISGTINAGTFDISGEEISAEPWQSFDFQGLLIADGTASGSFIFYWDGDCYGDFEISRQSESDPIPE